jgi:hypothetical protein
MVTRQVIYDHADRSEEQSTGVKIMKTGAPPWILKVDYLECDADGGFTEPKREPCDTEEFGSHEARVELAVEEGYAPDPMEELLRGAT